MAVVLNKKNNVKLKIEAPMTSVSNLLIVDKGELLGDDFTSAETEKHFKGTLFKFDGENVSQIEISKVITKSGNFLTLERAVESCPMNYSSNQMYQQAYDFEAGDWFYINLTAGDLEDIITELKNTNTRIDTTNTNITNNYVSNAQLQAQKGQPGGIATLDENSKIPGTQINTSTLQVENSLVEMTAGENIAIGTAVTTGLEKTVSQTEREQFTSVFPGNDYRYQDLFTFTTQEDLKYIKLTLGFSIGISSNFVLRILQNGAVLQTSKEFGFGTAYPQEEILDMYVNSNISGTLQLQLGYKRNGSGGAIIKYKDFYVIEYGDKVYKYNPSELVTEYSGIALETKNAGENIRIATDGNITTYSGLVPGAEYYIQDNGTISQFTGPFTFPTNTKVIAGIALNESILNINKNNPKLEVLSVNIAAATSTSSTITPSVITIEHNLQTTPKNILIWYCLYNETSNVVNLSNPQGIFYRNGIPVFHNYLFGVTEKNKTSITITNNMTTAYRVSILLIA